jgi:hypothetical protein
MIGPTVALWVHFTALAQPCVVYANGVPVVHPRLLKDCKTLAAVATITRRKA